MRIRKQVLAVAAVPVLIGGWALFRPELLFVNQKVNETLPTQAGQMAKTLAEGGFESYAHETTGQAQIVSVDGKAYLRLSNFKTSNGPDVHVYLVKGSDGDQQSVNSNGFLDLGTIKGNEGDQNYALPSHFSLAEYGAVAIWCKRFGVDFGGATLKQKTASRVQISSPYGQLAAFSDEIQVTAGPLMGSLPGRAELVESKGKRFVRIAGLKGVKGKMYQVWLLKTEAAKTAKDVFGSPRIELGKAMDRVGQYSIDDSVDAWLYRSAAIVDASAKRVLSIAHLRSAQEKKTGAENLELIA